MAQNDDLGIYSDEPLLYKALKFIDNIIYKLFLGPKSIFLSDYIFLILISLLVGIKMMLESGSIFFDIVLFILLVICCSLWGLVILKFFATGLLQFLFGKPVFGKVGGLEKVIFFTSLKCSRSIKFEFNDKDSKLVKAFNDLDIKVTEALLKENYKNNIYNTKYKDDSLLEENWNDVWNNQILEVSTNGIKYRDIIDENNFAFRVMPLKLIGVFTLISPLAKFFQLILIIILSLYLFDYISLISAIQLGVLSSFFLSMLLFIHHTYKLAEIPLLPDAYELPEQIKNEFSTEITMLKGRNISPKNITVNKSYISYIRDYMARLIVSTSINSVLTLILVGITLVLGFIWIKEVPDETLKWYRNFSLGIIIIQLGFIAGHYVTFFILNHIKKIFAPILVVIVTALLPIIVEYILTGNFKWDETKNIVLTAIAGTGLVISTVLTSLIRKKLEED